MRFLNKIIFINSAGASIPYAEVCLDGNVHFIGTQGVGKSTLLRSILFFYNADTRKLGIREGQKTYTEFYYPVLNSYIIYEIKTDNGFFTILTFKHKNQIAFRFIDSEYKKENYIANGKHLKVGNKSVTASTRISTILLSSANSPITATLYTETIRR